MHYFWGDVHVDGVLLVELLVHLFAVNNLLLRTPEIYLYIYLSFCLSANFFF